ncbi:MAG: hypothetical protein ACXWEG_01985 [Actinomycetota bacterium]
MAIKGKGRTKGRQPTRAPRRAPVEVQPPLLLRRWVQVSLAFIAGFLVMMLVVWVTNGLRQQRADDKAATEASEQRTSGQKWKSQVEGALGRVGTLSPGAPPALFRELGTTISGLQKGDVPDGATATIKKAQADAKLAIDPLKKYDLSGQVRDIGMSEGQVSWFLNSQTRIVQALELYEQAAASSALAIVAPDDQRAAIADGAAAIQDRAAEILQDGWSEYQNALGSVQILDSSLTSLTGPTGA